MSKQPQSAASNSDAAPVVQVPRRRGRPPGPRKKDPVDTLVGERVRQLRKFRGMSQTELGEKVGVVYEQIQKYENGTSRIPASTLFRLAKAMEVDVGHFFVRPGLAEEQAPFSGKDPFSTPEAIELMRHFHSVRDPEQQRRLLKLFAGLVDLVNQGR